jgi:hypothetical protein
MPILVIVDIACCCCSCCCRCYCTVCCIGNSWNKKTFLEDSGKVNCYNVVMANGKSLIMAHIECQLCGEKSGLKSKCGKTNCCYTTEKKLAPHFHISCARQAGLELSSDLPGNNPFDGTCKQLGWQSVYYYYCCCLCCFCFCCC